MDARILGAAALGAARDRRPDPNRSKSDATQPSGASFEFTVSQESRCTQV